MGTTNWTMTKGPEEENLGTQLNQERRKSGKNIMRGAIKQGPRVLKINNHPQLFLEAKPLLGPLNGSMTKERFVGPTNSIIIDIVQLATSRADLLTEIWPMSQVRTYQKQQGISLAQGKEGMNNIALLDIINRIRTETIKATSSSSIPTSIRSNPLFATSSSCYKPMAVGAARRRLSDILCMGLKKVSLLKKT